MLHDEPEKELHEQDELYEHYRIQVDKGQSLLRIDKFLINRIENVSRNRVQAAITAGSVRVNGREVKSSYKVKPGEVITVVLAHPPREVEIYCDNIPLEIIFEDEHLVLVNKKAGMVVHPAYGNYRNTLVNALAYHFNPQLEGKPVISESIRPGLVHRIDKNTSGLIIIAKNEVSMTHLAAQFYNRTIRRNYTALVWGDLKEEEGTITGHIGRNRKDRKIMEVFPEGDSGKHAVTHYKVMKRFHHTTLVDCKLETGRTHQIRVHFQYIGHPLFGDSEYGGNRIVKGTVTGSYRQFVEKCFSVLPRQALHARSLGFIHPATGKEMYFESPLPDDMQQVIEKWRSQS
ncbi:MAG: RluA family pseudouridine synthase [Bacteroidia bacterium]|nr:RluA family pseudouridine synthase [Bacteroidia bacterium]